MLNIPLLNMSVFLGKGKTGSRSLSYEEAYQAFTMILKGEVLDVQLGAF